MAERPFAEVIGDPVAHSRSPLIHHHWLQALGIAGEYRATRVGAAEVGSCLRKRRGDPDWRGCNVTAPHKQAVLPFMDRLDPTAAAVGAVNCIASEGGDLVGYNTDVDGVAEAVRGFDPGGRKVVVIGAGGAARAAVQALLPRLPAELVVLARNPEAAAPLSVSFPSLRVAALAEAEARIAGAALILNATPMGMAHAAAMPDPLLQALAAAAPGAIAFDMV